MVPIAQSPTRPIAHSPNHRWALGFLFSTLLPHAATAQRGPAIEAPPFAVHFWGGARRLAIRVGNSAQNMEPLPGIPNQQWKTRPIDIVLAPSEPAFNAATGGRAPEWGAGVAIPSRSLVVLPAFGSAQRGGPLDYGVVLRHELAHIGLHRALRETRIPVWFDEGYATWSARQLDWDAGWILRLAFITGSAPPLDSLALEWPRNVGEARIAYLLSASVIEFLVDESGVNGLSRLFERWQTSGDFESSLAQTYGTDLGQLESQWRKYVKRHYGWTVVFTQTAIFGILATGIVMILFWIRRKRDRRKLAALRASELPDAPAFWSEGAIEIIAHRGYSARAPENTIAAMELAIRHGAAALEFDIHATRDGVPVVIHDATLERTTNGQGRVAHRTLEELRALDAGVWFSPLFVDEGIPALEDVLRIAYGRVNRVYIELKPGGFTPAQLEVVVELLVRFEFADRCVVMSFDWGLLDDLRAIPIPITIAFLADDAPAFLMAVERARRDGNALVDCNYRVLLADPDLARQAHAAGIDLAVYTVNDTASATALAAMGVYRLTTNELERLLKWAAGRDVEPD